MLATLAPATLPTNCRRDIVIKFSHGMAQASGCLPDDWAIYPTEVINDQAITRAQSAGSMTLADQGEGIGPALTRCGIELNQQAKVASRRSGYSCVRSRDFG